MPVGPLVFRLDGVEPITPTEGDQNIRALRDAIVALEAQAGASLNIDGTLKAGGINNINIFSAAVLALLSPVGTVLSTVHPTLGTDAGADGWIYADGSAVSRSGNFLALFTLIGTTYGIGNGTTTFNLPDLRDRLLMCTSTGGLSAGRDTARVLASEVASPVGKEKVSLILTETPPHEHDIVGRAYDETQPGLSPNKIIIDDDYLLVNKTVTTQSAGGTAGVVVPHENLPPVAVIRMLIKL